MNSRFRLLICLAATALFLSACSSTTVVARDERAIATTDDATSQANESTNSDADSDADEGADVDTDPDDDADSDVDPDADVEDDDERGGRDIDESTEGFGLGGAEQLESLFVDCEGGNDLACDVLFQISAFDSDEETAAITCGGRSDTEVAFCTAGIDAAADNELVFNEDSDGLDRVVEACQDDANMTACDFLFYRSPIDSDFQEIGGTCGGRVNVAIPDCRTAAIDE